MLPHETTQLYITTKKKGLKLVTLNREHTSVVVRMCLAQPSYGSGIMTNAANNFQFGTAHCLGVKVVLYSTAHEYL